MFSQWILISLSKKRSQKVSYCTEILKLTSEWLTAYEELLKTGEYSFVPVTWTLIPMSVVNWGKPPSVTVITNKYDFTDSKSRLERVVTRPLPSTANKVMLPKVKRNVLTLRLQAEYLKSWEATLPR